MVPRSLERSVFRLLHPAPPPCRECRDRATAVQVLRTAMERVERRNRRRKLAGIVKSFAQHLVLKGDASE